MWPNWDEYFNFLIFQVPVWTVANCNGENQNIIKTVSSLFQFIVYFYFLILPIWATLLTLRNWIELVLYTHLLVPLTFYTQNFTTEPATIQIEEKTSALFKRLNFKNFRRDDFTLIKQLYWVFCQYYQLWACNKVLFRYNLFYKTGAQYCTHNE